MNPYVLDNAIKHLHQAREALWDQQQAGGEGDGHRRLKDILKRLDTLRDELADLRDDEAERLKFK